MKKKAFMMNNHNIKQATGTQVTLDLEIKLRK